MPAFVKRYVCGTHGRYGCMQYAASSDGSSGINDHVNFRCIHDDPMMYLYDYDKKGVNSDHRDVESGMQTEDHRCDYAEHHYELSLAYWNRQKQTSDFLQ